MTRREGAEGSGTSGGPGDPLAPTSPPGPAQAQANANANEGESSREIDAPPVFQSDASVSGEHMARVLRARGYRVVDVHLSLLVARAATQRPAAVLLDADAEDALDVARRLRELPGGDTIPVLAFGDAGEPTAESQALRNLSTYFTRPVDIERAASVLQALVPAGAEDSFERAAWQSAPPRPSGQPFAESPPPSRSSRVVAEFGADMPRSIGGLAVSDELASILAAAEDRISRSSAPSSNPRSSDEPGGAALSADVLASLSEILDDPVGDATDGRSIWKSQLATASRTGVDGSETAKTDARGQGGPIGTGAIEAPRPTVARDHELGGVRATAGVAADEDVPTPPPSAVDSAPPHARGGTGSAVEAEPATPRLPGQRGDARVPDSLRTPPPPGLFALPESTRPEIPAMMIDGAGPDDDDDDGHLVPLAVDLPRDILPTLAPPRPNAPIPRAAPASPDAPRRPSRAPLASIAPPPIVSIPPPEPSVSVLLETDAIRLLGRAIANRHSGCLCFDGEGGLRRIVLRDGDLVAVGSSVDNESLVAYLTDRGELPRDVGKRLAGRVPPFGRLAGAALIAAGHLMQDRLWEVLRAHAEWIVGRILLLQRASCGYETEAPGRLKTEPGMFGGSTGAEVFVEIVRRVLEPDAAIGLLGGPQARLTEGSAPKLLAEAALAHNEEDLVARAAGSTVRELGEAVDNPDFVAALFGLVCLGVLEALPAASKEEAVAQGSRAVDPLDEEALRTRVRARLELVEESDYFTLLGVGPTATGYEIKRAYLSLRRSYDPGKVVTPKTLDLVDSLRLISEIIDEAYEILRDPARRDRYARAINARPD